MKMTLTATGKEVEVACPAEAHVGTANGTFVRQPWPRSEAQIAKRQAKIAAAKKRAKKSKKAKDSK